jgi:hypothetical protein
MSKLMHDSGRTSLVLSDATLAQALKAYVEKDDKEALVSRVHVSSSTQFVFFCAPKEVAVNDLLEAQRKTVHSCAGCAAPEEDEIRTILEVSIGVMCREPDSWHHVKAEATKRRATESTTAADAAGADGVIVIASQAVKPEARAKREPVKKAVAARKPAAKRTSAKAAKANDGDDDATEEQAYTVKGDGDNDDDNDEDLAAARPTTTTTTKRKQQAVTIELDDEPKSKKAKASGVKRETKPELTQTTLTQSTLSAGRESVLKRWGERTK